jgi:hypothetical protein
VKTLEIIKAYLEKEGDPQNALSNVHFLLTAYRKRVLVWHTDKVTYWSNGKQLYKPEPLDSKRLLRWGHHVV